MEKNQFKREIIFVLIRIWSIRAIKELDMIDGFIYFIILNIIYASSEELRMLEQFDANRNSDSGQQASTSKNNEGNKNSKSIIIKLFYLLRCSKAKTIHHCPIGSAKEDFWSWLSEHSNGHCG